MTRHFLHSISLLRDSVPDWSEHPFSVPAIQKQLLRAEDEMNFGGNFRLGVEGESYSLFQT